jgi:hypothetical protein
MAYVGAAIILRSMEGREQWTTTSTESEQLWERFRAE